MGAPQRLIAEFDVTDFAASLSFDRDVAGLHAVCAPLAHVIAARFAPHLPLERRAHRRDDRETGNRQFAVADPDGHLPRFSPIWANVPWPKD